MLKISTKEDLQRLVDDEIQESLTLDYKASPALARDDKQRDELCKDVSAFANSAGGQIIYGIEEKDSKPIKVDDGSDLSREWIEQVIDSRVQPRLDGLVITPVPVGSGRHAYVLTIPQASGRAPHQAPDKKYYKRQNFQSAPMEDYEIRDALRRATTPELYVELSFATGERANVEFAHQSDRSKPITLSVIVRNRSSQPAHYALVQVGIDTELSLHTLGDFFSMEITGDGQEQQHWLGHRFMSPPGMPIFKEIEQDAAHRLSLTFTYPSSRLPGDTIFYLTTSVQTAGYAATEDWVIHHRGNILRLRRKAAG
jgi:Putative DNA-binding domain